jgi:uncharacterized protein YegL
MDPILNCTYDADCRYYEKCWETGWSEPKPPAICGLKSEYDYCYSALDCKKNHFRDYVNYYCNWSSHKCEKIPGSCFDDGDCAGYPYYCNRSSVSQLGECLILPGYCVDDSNCGNWEHCSFNMCVANKGYCNEDIECIRSGSNNVCSDDHICVEGQRQVKSRSSPPLDNVPSTKSKIYRSDLDIVMILDTSGSMSGEKLEEAKNGSIALLDSISTQDPRISLINFNGCQPELVAGFDEDISTIKQNISNFDAHGSTPITDSLALAYSYLENKSAGNNSFVILFTDGRETCSIDPCEVVKNQTDKQKIPIHTIGYIVGKSAEDQLVCISNESGGKYFNASSVGSLKDVFTEVAKAVTGACELDSDCLGNNVCVNNACASSKLHLVYLPVNWNPGTTELDNEIKNHHDSLLNSIPSLESCNNLVKRTVINQSLTVNNIRQLKSSQSFNKIEKFVKNNYANSYDYIVAIGSADSFSGTKMGYTKKARNIVFVKKGNPLVTAHEMGHQFGLYDEYCSCPGEGYCDEEPNPLTSDLGCDVYGDCCWENFKLFGFTIINNSCSEPYGCSKCCWGNKNLLGGRSIMSWSNAPGPRQHDNVSLDHFATDERLRCN